MVGDGRVGQKVYAYITAGSQWKCTRYVIASSVLSCNSLIKTNLFTEF